MSNHTLAVIYLAALVFSMGCSLGYPKDTRPWNSPRIAGTLVGLIGGIAACVVMGRAL